MRHITWKAILENLKMLLTSAHRWYIDAQSSERNIVQYELPILEYFDKINIYTGGTWRMCVWVKWLRASTKYAKASTKIIN